MKIKVCPKCGKQNDENAWNCADCGTTLSVKTVVDLDIQNHPKIKLCPQCGKQNDVNAWSCADCGATLSIKTIVDGKDIKTARIELSQENALSYISPCFREDYAGMLAFILHGEESVIKGCDINQYSETPPFEFGYLILTSEKLICVSFISDVKSELFERIPSAFLPHHRGGMTTDIITGTERRRVHMAIDKLDSPLTESEAASRKLTTLHPKELYSADLISDLELRLKIRHGDGISLDSVSFHFYFNNEAYEMYSLLNEWVKK